MGNSIKANVNSVDIARTDSGSFVYLRLDTKFDAIIIDDSGEFVEGKSNVLTMPMAIAIAKAKTLVKEFRRFAMRSEIKQNKLLTQALINTVDGKALSLEDRVAVRQAHRNATSNRLEVALKVVFDCATITFTSDRVEAGNKFEDYEYEHTGYVNTLTKVEVDGATVSELLDELLA